MLIIPAIDLKDGACVRLLRGAFDDVTEYGAPEAHLDAFARSGATWAHVVDLDGARAGTPIQHELVCGLARSSRVRLQCGGGVRERTHVSALLQGGVARVVVGSLAVTAPDELREWLCEFGAERICAAFDVRANGGGWEVAVNGWRQVSGRSLTDALRGFPPGALKHVLVTDISRDGALEGANAALIRDLAALRPDLAVQASGGVATLDDLSSLAQAGAAATIVGRALYERRFSLEDALAL
ncbi:MAG TPA: 1-(5-phosphoribosyl)-5-[(5-phosphoribosylamino)methylideneamino] imidazole-4-carboxamide isomerase [Vitreimonas sp.]|uniref:1-(5-phosphoribosyl)-5-[(5- phosphoribosylamino)methylideneamino]imidazole-4- carboxamide isomerase n=1 Tax=Vitreimonas sp. TaxID=3069702 RepID=UPI002D3939F5|nr:1-(5-phosphoribosyl)-5-[(5-phosphoribosylamino)methylideneamino] imidazole-4-carboxamide isomerase [Vitreimonas sp.]HYD88088.1 1-(5-phosphoribosyl)-5-[(5-phosphoribosylamino)methylideneamino] imidazole-4-carboxamide isomerase [Vitreimonas sp.]